MLQPKIKPPVKATNDTSPESKDSPDSLNLIQTVTADKITLMKKGDYSIHILIEEIKSCEQKEEDALPSPIVKVTCFETQSQRTQKPPQTCTDFTYNEHFYFDETNLSVEQLDSSKIIIEAYDSNHCSKRKDYFGIHEFDLEYIYNKPNHCLKNFWLALANPESEDITKVRAYLKLSLSVLLDSDPRVELNIDDDANSNFVLPSQVEQKYKQVRIYILKAEGIPDMDALGKEKKVNRSCQGYIEIKYLGITRTTQVVEMKNDIICWNEFVDIAVSVPCVSQRIVMLVKDRDVGDIINGDDDIGSIEIDINDVLEGKYKGYEFFNIYGAPLNKSGKYFKKMNQNAEIGSRWKGRILMKIECTDTDMPQNKIQSITDEKIIKDSVNIKGNNHWTVRCKLYSALYLPEEDSKYSVRIEMQEQGEDFLSNIAKNGNIEWNKIRNLQVFTLTENVEELPDLFIYLVNEDGLNICFQRIKPLDLYLNEQIMIIKLIPDPCINEVKYLVNSGLIKMKISIVNQVKDKDKDLSYLDRFKEGDSNLEDDDLEDLENIGKVQQYANYKEYTIVSIVYMSRYLMVQDSNSQNDPYVKIKCIDNEQKTVIKHNTVNGIWNNKLKFDKVKLDINNKSTWPILLVKVVDSDVSGDDLLGYCYLWLCDAPYKINNIDTVRPKWYNLFLPKSNQQQGQLLLSFYILDSTHSNLYYNINPVPKTTPYSFEINILGLRDLKPLSIIPVKKAYIDFDMNSLNVTGEKKDDLLPVKTEPRDSGPNPTLNSVVKFDIKLPLEDMFMPEMQCEVHDHLLKGLSNPLLGVFMLKIKDIIVETHSQIEEDLKSTNKKVGLFLAKSLIRSSIKTYDYNSNEPNDKNNNKDSKGNEFGSNKILLQKENQEKNKNDAVIEISNVPPNSSSKKKEETEQKLRTLLTKEEIESNLYNPDLFAVLPEFKAYTIPNKKDCQNEFIIEDTADSVDKDGNYFPIGYLRKIEYDLLDENIKETKDYSKIQDINRPETVYKHYRRIFHQPLETVKELNMESPFIKSVIKRGKDTDIKDENAIFEAISNKKNKIIKKYIVDYETGNIKDKDDEKVVKKLKSGRRMARNRNKMSNENYGIFKGVIRICEKKKMDEYNKTIKKYRDDNPSLLEQFKNLNKYETLMRNILVKKQVIIRLYILELRDLAKKDLIDESDPYIKIFLGDELKFDECENHKENETNSKIYKYYDILTELPGQSTLTIQVYDYDQLFKDELIGETTIDLEDRFFNQNWREMKFKPIEVRQLRHPDFSNNQGSIYLWLEILEKNERIEMKHWLIEPQPDTYIQCRFIVYETENMENMDVEDTSDVFINAYIRPEEKQSTDIHYRCQTGVASFNWRMIFPIYYPRDKRVITVQAYDNDFFKRNDLICHGQLDLTDLMKITAELDVPIVFNKEYVDNCDEEHKSKYENVEFVGKDIDSEGTKFWLQLYKNNEKKGRVLCSCEFLPKWKADVNKVGLGRKEPNICPYLPPPVGRLKFSLNPFTMINQFVGPKFRKKCYITIILVCVGIYIICMIPFVVYHVTGELANPFNYFK